MLSSMLEELEIMMQPVMARISNVVSRGVVKLANDALAMQGLQLGVLVGEDMDVEHFQPYGFSSIPLAGAEAVVVFPGGDRAHPIALAVTDRTYRPTGGTAGEVTVYHKSGSYILLRDDGTIEVRAKAGQTVDVMEVGGAALGATDELVHGTGVDPFTGSTYKVLTNTTGTIRAKK